MEIWGKGRVAGHRINQEELSENRIEECKQMFSLFVWLTRSVNHTMPGPKIFIPGFVTVNRAPVTWFAIVKSTLGFKASESGHFIVSGPSFPCF